ncbi:amidase [Pseudomonas sp. NY15374]|uniref:amidase n=1 Tax=Pseudomonas sp. NY15374 TaxID=3400357 RepID=UPI003A857B68
MTIIVSELDLGTPGGLRVAVKDTIDVEGVATRASSPALEDSAVPQRHADVVANLLTAGAHLTAKVSLHELAFGTTGINRHVGTAANPRFPGRIPGGSSSGSAAVVAAGLADFSLGTDTGGSVRIPACCCGVFGLKPSFGRVSRAGVMPEHTTLDCVGPFANSLPMLEIAMGMIDPSYRPSPIPDRPTIGVLQVSARAEVAATVAQALLRSGLPVQDLAFEHFTAAYEAGMVIINRETYQACGHLLQSQKVGADVAARLSAAAMTDEAAVARAEHTRRLFSAEVDQALTRFDVIALPTMPDFPLRLEEAGDTSAVLGMTALVRPFNLSGHPALSLPLASECGLPVGLQLVGAKGKDAQLLAAAQRVLMNIYGARS